MSTSAKPLTALEQKWQEEEANKVPTLDDAYTQEGFDPNKLDASVLKRIPDPTGWRMAILPYRGAERTKGGIVLAEETQRRQNLATVCGYVLKLGPLAYADEAKDANNPNTKIVALKGSTSQAFAEQFLDKTTLYTTDTYDEAVDMVLQDKVHAMIADYPICVVSVFRYPDAGLLSVVTQLTYEPIGIAMPPNDPLLVNWTQNTLNNIEGSGQLDELKLKWFAEGDWLNKLK